MILPPNGFRELTRSGRGGRLRPAAGSFCC